MWNTSTKRTATTAKRPTPILTTNRHLHKISHEDHSTPLTIAFLSKVTTLYALDRLRSARHYSIQKLDLHCRRLFTLGDIALPRKATRTAQTSATPSIRSGTPRPCAQAHTTQTPYLPQQSQNKSRRWGGTDTHSSMLTGISRKRNMRSKI